MPGLVEIDGIAKDRQQKVHVILAQDDVDVTPVKDPPHCPI
jgi:hypothetical protein